MNKINLTFILMLLCFCTSAQKKKSTADIHPPTVAKYNILQKRMTCLYRNKYSALERLKFYPFNKSKKVLLISFDWPEPPTDEIIGIDGTIVVPSIGDTIPPLETIQQRHQFYKKIAKETRVLNVSEINKLTNTLFNFGYTSNKSYNGILGVVESYRCYEPRNAILFLDKNDRLFAYLDLCFDCHKFESSSEEIKIGEICNEKFSLIQRFFTSVGIKYVKREYKE